MLDSSWLRPPCKREALPRTLRLFADGLFLKPGGPETAVSIAYLRRPSRRLSGGFQAFESLTTCRWLASGGSPSRAIVTRTNVVVSGVSDSVSRQYGSGETRGQRPRTRANTGPRRSCRRCIERRLLLPGWKGQASDRQETRPASLASNRRSRPATFQPRMLEPPRDCVSSPDGRHPTGRRCVTLPRTVSGARVLAAYRRFTRQRADAEPSRLGGDFRVIHGPSTTTIASILQESYVY
jgi:hypothetical protein